MRITESNVTMAAARSYSQSGRRSGSLKESTSFEDVRSSLSHSGFNTGGLDMYSRGGYGSQSRQDIFNNYTRFGGGTIGDIGAGVYKANSFQNSILRMLMGRFMQTAFGAGSTHRLITYEEHENTQFQAEGSAKTDDGRIIDFRIDISMSRSYMEYMNISAPSIQNVLCDPLIVNTGTSLANIRDQKFMFDIDSDGMEDEISMPGRGSGFLALDINEDGTINDGSELFGTKSGDGFSDLKQYDSDGNGWIDESDEIFSRLRIWCKGDDGEDILMNLKDADIGAIFLGSQSTEFTLNGTDGIRDGVLRSSGFFLKESGGVGTVQQVDMAINDPDAGNNKAADGSMTIRTINVNISAESRQSRSFKARERRREALAKKHAANLKIQKDTQRRHTEKKVSLKKFEEKLDMQRQVRRKKEKERLEDNILERLFEDRQNEIV